MDKTKPNVIVIMSDQHNPAIMGCAGDPYVKTPNLDRLAQNGVRFNNAYCANPLCVPSRMAFMTGRYGSEIDVWTNRCQLSSAVPTFAHGLGAAGYETVLCGKMHFRGPDQWHGFERRLVGESGGDIHSLNVMFRPNGDKRHAHITGMSDYSVKVSGHGLHGFQVYDQHLTETAIEWIRERSDERPYCMVVGYILPHDPYIAQRELFDYYMDVLPPLQPVGQGYLDTLHPAMQLWRQRHGVHLIEPDEANRARAAYYALITEMDSNIGRIMDAVAGDDTVIVYTSDHGDMAGDKGFWWKGSFYEGSVGVPLIASWPVQLSSGLVRQENVSLIDVGPTLLELAAGPALPHCSGRSILPLLQEEPVAWPDTVFSEYYGLLDNQPSCMLKQGGLKLIYHTETDSCQLFDVEHDPDELNDLASLPAYSAFIADGRARISGYWHVDRMHRKVRSLETNLNYIKRCGHKSGPTNRFPKAKIALPQGCNQFDTDQLKDWERIKREGYLE